jgi:autotransporter family porin
MRNDTTRRIGIGSRTAMAILLVVGVILATGCEPSTAHFSTLSPSATLPTGATCAGQVRAAPEVRARNKTANQTRGKQKNLTTPFSEMKRVDGDKVGTTDELIQWAACKWGIDEDIVRAQAAVESWWDQGTVGDFTSDSSSCIPGHGKGVDGRAGQCPASGGLLSLTYQYYQGGFPEAMTSTAYNLDYVYAWWRACYTGKVTWLNTVERGSTYQAGDAWGCVGAWYAGRWHTPAADGYIAQVKGYLDKKIWTTANFTSS